MIRGVKIFIGFFSLLLFQACGILGIHLHVKNPRNSGSYPKETRAMHLLAQQSPRRTCFDVNYYKLDLDLALKKRFIKGDVLIRSVLLSSADSIQIDLYKNLRINSILINDRPAVYSREEGAVFIRLPKNVAVGQTFSIVVNYEGKIAKAHRPPWNGGITWKKDKSKKVWAGISCESEGASIWWPNKDDVSDEADSVDMVFTIPAGLNIISNGIFKGEQVRNKLTKTASWHVSYPINNYNITFYIGEFKLIADTFISKQNKDTIPISYYVLDKHYGVAKEHFQQVKQQLAFYESVFGCYPWPKDGFKLIESPYEGMEHQTAIAYGDKFENSREGFDYIVLHESAHEWWGNSVTAADLSDVWLQEGFATYAEALFVEATKGKSAYLEYLFWQRLTIKNKRPVVRPRGLRYFSPDDEDVYNKGSWILHSLRTTLKNDSLFFDILKTFRNDNHLKQVFSETFTALVNMKTGRDFDWFFKQYLYRREAPILEYYWAGDYFYYKWKDTNNDFSKLPVALQFGANKKTVYPDSFLQKLKIEDAAGTTLLFPGDDVYYGHEKNARLISE